jgi:hypothetical protein
MVRRCKKHNRKEVELPKLPPDIFGVKINPLEPVCPLCIAEMVRGLGEFIVDVSPLVISYLESQKEK